MKDVKKEKGRKPRSHSSSPPWTKVKVKRERQSPVRPQRHHSSSSSASSTDKSKSRSSRSPSPLPPPPPRSGTRRKISERSPKWKDISPGKWRSRAPKYHRSRSRSPHQTESRVKQERNDYHKDDSYRVKEERRNRERTDTEHKRGRNGYREQSGSMVSHYEKGTSSGGRGKKRDAQNFREQREEREFYDDQRRRNRRKAELHDSENQNSEKSHEKVNKGKKGEKEVPNFQLSGALVEDTNTFRGVVIKYNEPPEARIPKKRWRLYPFKNDTPLPVMYIHRQSAYLLGRQRKIADIPIDHPSCSKQHAVLQYRLVEYARPDDATGRRVKPYIIDLGSANGTFLNNQRVEPQRFYELKEKDVLKFGFSSREYVLLHEFSDTTEVDGANEEDDEGIDS